MMCDDEWPRGGKFCMQFYILTVPAAKLYKLIRSDLVFHVLTQSSLHVLSSKFV